MQIAIKELEGRDHYVVPTVMITVGVWNGSHGPVYYPPEELQQSAAAWNGKPVVVYHPEMYAGGFVGHPEVFNRQKIGTLFNTRFEKGKLKADAWIDVERVQRVDPRVETAIQEREVLEVSTGLVFPRNRTQGTFNGKTYYETAQNIIPDHLAILPDKTGACSIADGAGLLRNNRVMQVLRTPTMSFG